MNYLIDTEKYSLVTADCFGYQYYFKNGNQYNTPFVSLLINLDCYLRLLENFNDFNNLTEIIKLDTTKYLNYINPKSNNFHKNVIETLYPPNYVLFGLKINNELIEIHNIHDTDYNKTVFKFKRRLNRLSKKNCIFILNDMNIKDTKDSLFNNKIKDYSIEQNDNNKDISKMYIENEDTFYQKFSNNIIEKKPYSYYVKKFINLKFKNQVIFCKNKNKDKLISDISKEHRIIFYPDNLNSAPCLWNYIKNNKISII